MMKRIVSTIIVLMLSLTSISYTFASSFIEAPVNKLLGNEKNTKPKITIDLKKATIKKDGEIVNSDIEAIMENNIVLVPLQKIQELLDAEIRIYKDKEEELLDEERKDRYILVEKDNIVIKFEIGSNMVSIISGGENNHESPVIIQKRKGVYYMPLALIVATLGGAMVVDEGKSEIEILTKLKMDEDFENGQEELKIKYHKLYKALDALTKKPFKRTS